MDLGKARTQYPHVGVRHAALRHTRPNNLYGITTFRNAFNICVFPISSVNMLVYQSTGTIVI